MPAGVGEGGGGAGGVGDGVPLLPPPQPTPVTRKAHSNRASRSNDILRLLGTPIQTSPASPTALNAASQTERRLLGSTTAVVAFVVATVNVVVPPPATELGLKLHLAPAGRPEQELAVKAIVPV